MLGGLGKFSITKREARMGRNPATGASIEIPAKRVVKFKEFSSFSEALNH
jgi:DNA-binding protein HU-beta